MGILREASIFIPWLLKRLLARLRIRPQRSYQSDLLKSKSVSYLQELMSYYQAKDLTNQTPQEFKAKLSEFLEVVHWEMEGFENPERQRGLSVKFHWGHNHDFGDFFLEGRMGNRHINLLATFADKFEALPKSLSGMKFLDIGCWTGGTSILLCKMGAHVVAIDEVGKYIEALNYLKYAFSIDNLEPMNLSLYDCTRDDFRDSFDYVLFAGVLYHVTDPILALRITFNCLKDGGRCLIETAAIDFPKSILKYPGPRPRTISDGSAKRLSASGWNWFIPSRPALFQMLDDVGYTNIRIGKIENGRLLATAVRQNHVDMMRSGLSSRTVR